MADLSSYLNQQTTKSVELGEIVNRKGNKVYSVLIDGVQRLATNTMSIDVSVGQKVIVNRMETGKRYIVARTGYIGKYSEVKRVYRNG